jgi:hypothetical protein
MLRVVRRLSRQGRLALRREPQTGAPSQRGRRPSKRPIGGSWGGVSGSWSPPLMLFYSTTAVGREKLSTRCAGIPATSARNGCAHDATAALRNTSRPRSLSPPQIPCVCESSSAAPRHSPQTSQPSQMALAGVVDSPRPGKNPEFPIPRQAARSCHAGRLMSSARRAPTSGMSSDAINDSRATRRAVCA